MSLDPRTAPVSGKVTICEGQMIPLRKGSKVRRLGQTERRKAIRIWRREERSSRSLGINLLQITKRL